MRYFCDQDHGDMMMMMMIMIDTVDVTKAQMVFYDLLRWSGEISIIGFSAGSILAVSLASYYSQHPERGDYLSDVEQQTLQQQQQQLSVTQNDDNKQPLARVIAVHGPDSLGRIMRYHSRSWVSLCFIYMSIC